jgi:hypothetical protein
MESAVLGVVLDSSVVITAERKKLAVTQQLVEAIQTAHGEIELSLSLVTVWPSLCTEFTVPGRRR